MIVYVDSSVVVRAYLPDEEGHAEAVRLIFDDTAAVVTGTWTRVEVTGALVRAARRGRRTARQLGATLGVLAADLGTDGPLTVISAPQRETDARALEIVLEHGLRAMDAWHLAVADLLVRDLAERGEAIGFASRDLEQSRVAETLGFASL